ncbi:MAG TPA: YqeG family HAD IIIA-type phosphatase [Acholeplasmataceae bacterium]|nr:YqeG family HAD IIIA-type phosphatase [Acholeplasmataceae bacterium]
MIKLKHLIPNQYAESIYNIDYDMLIKQGIKTLLFDLDNTIIDYNQTKLNAESITFLNKLEKDFKVIIISNSMNKRVSHAIEKQFKFISFAKKPLKFGFKKALKMIGSTIQETVMIGDQLLTDIYGANRLGLATILVDPIQKKTDKWPTRFNRKLEKYLLKKIERKYPEAYQKGLNIYAIKHY